MSSPYSRLFPQNHAVKPWRKSALRALGEAMRESKPEGQRAAIPAAYTYFGQLVGHDTSFLAGAGPEPMNARRRALRLDTVFPSRSRQPETASSALDCLGGLCIGQTTAGRHADLPRGQSGRALIPDGRNDHSLILAQLIVALTRRYHQFQQGPEDMAPEAARARLEALYREVIAGDYLPRIVDEEIIDDVARNGRALVYPDGVTRPFQPPIEFAAAFYRFGHSMVRSDYRFDVGERHAVASSLSHTGLGGNIGKRTGYRLMDDWTVSWRFFIGGEDDTSPDLAEPINTRVSAPLTRLPHHYFAVEKGEYETFHGDLSARAQTLAERFALPSAPAAIEACNRHLREGSSKRLLIEQVPHQSMEALRETGFGEVISQYSELEDLVQAPPLWFYTLIEAQMLRRGARLGPLAGRIVYETLHAALEAAKDDDAANVTIISHEHKNFGIGATPGKVSLWDLLCT